MIGYYRQWQVPGVRGSNEIQSQVNRLKSLLNVVSKVKHKSDIIIASDTNIYTSSHVITKAREVWDEFLQVNDFTVLDNDVHAFLGFKNSPLFFNMY